MTSLQVGAFSPDQDSPAPRHEIHETAELQRDGSEIGIDIRVVEFKRGEDQFVGMVVQEFRSLVEKRRVVFIAFDDEFFPAAEAVAAVAEIRRHAANQEVRPAAGDCEKSRRAWPWWWFFHACPATTIEVCPGMK